MTRPKTRPSRQTRSPQTRSFCPVMAPLRKETLFRSGRTRLASLPWVGCPALADSCGAMAGLAEGLETVGTLCACATATQTRSIARTSTRIVQDFINNLRRWFPGEIRATNAQCGTVRGADCSRGGAGSTPEAPEHFPPVAERVDGPIGGGVEE